MKQPEKMAVLYLTQITIKVMKHTSPFLYTLMIHMLYTPMMLYFILKATDNMISHETLIDTSYTVTP